MRRRTVFRAARLGLAVVAALALARERPGLAQQRQLSLEEALQLAQAKNRDLQAARARLEQSAENVALARAALLPQVALRGLYTHNYKQVTFDFGQFNKAVIGLVDVLKATSGNPAQTAALDAYEQQLIASTPTPLDVQLSDQFDGRASAAVPLLVPYAYPALLAARRSYGADEANFEVTEAGVLLSVAQVFYTAAGADELVKARANAIAVAGETLGYAKVSFEVGRATKVDVMRAQVAVVRAEQAEAEAEDDRVKAYRALATLLDVHEPLLAVPSRASPAEPPAVEALVGTALQKRPELEVYRNAIEAAGLTESSKLWSWAPSLSAFGTATVSNSVGFTGNHYAWAVGAQLDWVLYDGGVRDAQRRQAAAKRRELEAELDLFRDTAADQVVDDWRRLRTARQDLDSALLSADLSRETLQMVRVQYEAGAATQLDVLQAQDSLVLAEVGIVQARFALALADLQLQHDAGLFPPAGSAP